MSDWRTCDSCGRRVSVRQDVARTICPSAVDAQREPPRRRLYSVTPAGAAEYERLMHAMEPFLDSIVESITLIKREVYGNGAVQRKKARAARKR